MPRRPHPLIPASPSVAMAADTRVNSRKRQDSPGEQSQAAGLHPALRPGLVALSDQGLPKRGAVPSHTADGDGMGRKKKCLDCQQKKPLTAFYKHRNGDGRQVYCVPCLKKRAQASALKQKPIPRRDDDIPADLPVVHINFVRKGDRLVRTRTRQLYGTV